MIKDNMQPYRLKITFYDSGVKRTKYADDRRYYDKLIAAHGHLSGLTVETLTLTPDQEARLSEIQSAGLSAHDASIYVQYGTTEAEDTGYFDAGSLEKYHQDMIAPAIKAQRKQAEAEGVYVNGIRYAGDASNRRAVSEAIEYANDQNTTVIPSWKDSDGNFHSDHPVADIKEAYRAIGRRRSALIALEGQHIAAVAAGEADIYELDWSVS